MQKYAITGKLFLMWRDREASPFVLVLGLDGSETGPDAPFFPIFSSEDEIHPLLALAEVAIEDVSLHQIHSQEAGEDLLRRISGLQDEEGRFPQFATDLDVAEGWNEIILLPEGLMILNMPSAEA